MTDTALSVVESPSGLLPSRNEYDTMLSMADAFLKSGLLPAGIKTPQAALLIMEKGREMRVPPLYALSNIAVIEGKPTAGAELLLSLVYRDHGDNAIRVTETTADRCTIVYRRRHWPQSETYAFSAEDAKRAGLLSKQNWQKYPAAMLRARCISAVARMAFPDSIGGLYTPEEMGADVEVTAEGDVQIVEAPRRPPAPGGLVAMTPDKRFSEPQSEPPGGTAATQTPVVAPNGVTLPPRPQSDALSDLLEWALYCVGLARGSKRTWDQIGKEARDALGIKGKPSQEDYQRIYNWALDELEALDVSLDGTQAGGLAQTSSAVEPIVATHAPAGDGDEMEF